jgi:hypothetical protein
MVDDNSGWCTVSMHIKQTAQGTNGSGDYLYSLPAGYTFDTTYHPGYAVFGTPSSATAGFDSIIPGSDGKMVNQPAGQATQLLAMVYNSTKFRLLVKDNSNWYGNTSGDVRVPQSSTYFQWGANSTTQVMIHFRFKKG